MIARVGVKFWENSTLIVAMMANCTLLRLMQFHCCSRYKATTREIYPNIPNFTPAHAITNNLLTCGTHSVTMFVCYAARSLTTIAMPQTHVMTHLDNYAATRVTVEPCPLARKVDRIYLKINYNSNLRVGVVTMTGIGRLI